MLDAPSDTKSRYSFAKEQRAHINFNDQLSLNLLQDAEQQKP